MTDPDYRLNFDPAESVRITRAVGFDPEKSDLARSCLESTLGGGSNITFYGDDEMQTAAMFEAALGLFVFLDHDEDADAIPEEVRDWYWRNVEMMGNGSFIVAVSDAA
jgi:hypothetical protein